MSKKEVLKRARATFKSVLGNPDDPNAKIIGARRTNNAQAFKPAEMIARSDNAGQRLKHAQEALNQLEPSLDRFKS
jgi:hypothetical protein